MTMAREESEFIERVALAIERKSHQTYSDMAIAAIGETLGEFQKLHAKAPTQTRPLLTRPGLYAGFGTGPGWKRILFCFLQNKHDHEQLNPCLYRCKRCGVLG